MFKKVRDILEYLQKVHEDVSDYYGRLANKEDKEKVQIFLDYLREHNDNLKEIISRYEEEGDNSLLDTWIQYSPQNTIRLEMEIIDFNPKMTIDEILEKALILDNWLENYYDYIAENAPSTKLKDVFYNLYQSIHQDKLQLVNGFNSLKEM